MLKNKGTYIYLIFVFICISLFSIFRPITCKAGDGPLDSFEFKYEYGEDGKASFSVNSTDAEIQKEIDGDFVDKAYSQGRSIIFGIFGICTLTMVILFILNFIKLGQVASSNPQERSQALKSLLYLGIATACLGGVTLFVGFSNSLLK